MSKKSKSFSVVVHGPKTYHRRCDWCRTVGGDWDGDHCDACQNLTWQNDVEVVISRDATVGALRHCLQLYYKRNVELSWGEREVYLDSDVIPAAMCAAIFKD